MIHSLDLKIKALRKRNHLTQNDLAKLLNITQSTIALYENGKKVPTLENLLALANYFNVSTDYLLGLSTTGSYCDESMPTNTLHENTPVYEINTPSKEHKKLFGYYDRLNEENKDYIIGKMIELYKEQENH